MIKIIWFSNCILSDISNKASGSWLYSMSKLLCDTNEVYLINIAISPRSNKIEHKTISENFEEYTLPDWKLNKKGLPAEKNINAIEKLCRMQSPDIIHVWGVENYFCHLLPTLNLNTKLLLEIQGLRNTCARVYYGDLSINELFQCIGFREILFPIPLSIFYQRARFSKLGEKDLRVLKLYKFISTQSEWIRSQIANHTDAKIFETKMSIRNEFLIQSKWVYPDNKEIALFWCSSTLFPYKSMQTAIKTLNVLKKEYATIKLYVVGSIKPRRNFLLNGYYKYIEKLIKRYGLVENVIYTGSLFPNEMIELMRKCVCSIQTSYVESYSLALAESTAIGLPAVVSYAGAMPELVENGVSGLFFSPGDYNACAYQIKKLITNREFAEKLSSESRKKARLMSSNDIVSETQLKIYNSILSSND